eukprot:1898911-Prymnesium_polylepis.1
MYRIEDKSRQCLTEVLTSRESLHLNPTLNPTYTYFFHIKPATGLVHVTSFMHRSSCVNRTQVEWTQCDAAGASQKGKYQVGKPPLQPLSRICAGLLRVEPVYWTLFFPGGDGGGQDLAQAASATVERRRPAYSTVLGWTAGSMGNRPKSLQ